MTARKPLAKVSQTTLTGHSGFYADCAAGCRTDGFDGDPFPDRFPTIAAAHDAITAHLREVHRDLFEECRWCGGRGLRSLSPHSARRFRRCNECAGRGWHRTDKEANR